MVGYAIEGLRRHAARQAASPQQLLHDQASSITHRGSTLWWKGSKTLQRTMRLSFDLLKSQACPNSGDCLCSQEEEHWKLLVHVCSTGGISCQEWE